MNQPKFKFGDKIQPTDNDPAVVVDGIVYVVTNSDGTGEYKYNGRYWESETILYQEPQKKKLVAIERDADGMIFFFSSKVAAENYVGENFTGFHVIDIEYPETHLK